MKLINVYFLATFALSFYKAVSSTVFHQYQSKSKKFFTQLYGYVLKINLVVIENPY